jgi:hypothetical protein
VKRTRAWASGAWASGDWASGAWAGGAWARAGPFACRSGARAAGTGRRRGAISRLLSHPPLPNPGPSPLPTAPRMYAQRAQDVSAPSDHQRLAGPAHCCTAVCRRAATLARGVVVVVAGGRRRPKQAGLVATIC